MENETKVKIQDCHSCVFAKDDYGLTINVDNTHVMFNTHHYDNLPGNHIDLTIFGLTKDDIYELARKIKEVADSLPDDVANLPEDNK